MTDERDAEIARLTDRVDELLAANNIEVAHRRRAEARAGELLEKAAQAGTALMRANIALAMVREWGIASPSWNATVAKTLADWIDTPSPRGSVPWPDSPFFEEWAERRGYSNFDGHVGFRLTMTVTPPAGDAA